MEERLMQTIVHKSFSSRSLFKAKKSFKNGRFRKPAKALASAMGTLLSKTSEGIEQKHSLMKHDLVRNMASRLVISARNIVRTYETRELLEKVLEMDSTRNMTIFNYDCIRIMSRLSKYGPNGWSAVLAAKQGNSIFIPFEPREDGQETPARGFFINRQSSPLSLSKKSYVFFLDNKRNFAEVKNLEMILAHTIEIMHESVMKGIPINPLQSFLLEFPKDAAEGRLANARLAMCIPDLKIDANTQEWISAYHNFFLDTFLGQNFRQLLNQRNHFLFDKAWGYNKALIEILKRDNISNMFI